VRGGNGRSQPTQSLGREASPASCSSFGCRSSPSNRHLAFFESVERGAASVRLVKTSRSEQAYAALKRQILDQDLQPGARLNIDALSRLLGVSSSPLREAMVRLEVEGLVVFTTNTGFSVAPLPDADQMRQLFEFRLLIETHCVRLGAARGEADDVAALTQATDAMAKMRRAGVGYEGYDAYFTPEQTFHQRIVESAGNSPIAAAYRGLDVVLDVARRSIVRESGRIGGSTARSSRPMLPLIRMRPRMQCADTSRQQKRR
jgi:DNA-binding GntR family transcriptional regulator